MKYATCSGVDTRVTHYGHKDMYDMQAREGGTMNTKVCRGCKAELTLEHFGTYPKNNRRYVKSKCIDCAAEYKQKWRKENPEKVKEQNRRANQGVNRRVTQKAYMNRNPGYKPAKDARRRARKLNASPVWANKEAIDFVYYAAACVGRVYGGTPHVDHIIPLCSDVVCGLHVHQNLQLLSPKDNTRKSNGFQI